MDDHNERHSRWRQFGHWLGVVLAVVSGAEFVQALLETDPEPWRMVWPAVGVVGLAMYLATRSVGNKHRRSPLDAWTRGIGRAMEIIAGWNAIKVAVGFDWSLAGTPEQYPDLFTFTFWTLLFVVGGVFARGDLTGHREPPLPEGSDQKS